jgi:hypothetical protein
MHALRTAVVCWVELDALLLLLVAQPIANPTNPTVHCERRQLLQRGLGVCASNGTGVCCWRCLVVLFLSTALLIKVNFHALTSSYLPIY